MARLFGMSISKLVVVLIVALSSAAFADATDKSNERKWTIQASEMYATKGNVDKKPLVSDPGVWVTAQRDPQDKR